MNKNLSTKSIRSSKLTILYLKQTQELDDLAAWYGSKLTILYLKPLRAVLSDFVLPSSKLTILYLKRCF